jgi:hypothetical protein
LETRNFEPFTAELMPLIAGNSASVAFSSGSFRYQFIVWSDLPGRSGRRVTQILLPHSNSAHWKGINNVPGAVKAKGEHHGTIG